MKLKTYPEYKDSGLPWLGEVPEHWGIRKIKYLFSERVQKGFPDEPLLAATQTKGVVQKDHYENRTVLAQKDLHLLKLVKLGDFVISLRSFQGGIEYAYHQGIISPAYTVMVPTSPIISNYFRHLAKSRTFIGLLKTCVTGIREGQNIDYTRLRRSSIPLPSEVEQNQIARFLDHKTRLIANFIRSGERLIELLQEQKQAIINHAVTRGIDPDVRLKPSGIDWPGDVPEHWEVVPLRWHISISSGEYINIERVSSASSAASSYPVIGGNGVMGYTNAINIDSTTIVLGRVGALCGNVHMIEPPAWVTDNALRIVRVSRFDHAYLSMQLESMDLNRLANANAQHL